MFESCLIVCGLSLVSAIGCWMTLDGDIFHSVYAILFTLLTIFSGMGAYTENEKNNKI
jgi:hypothetical protein